MIMSVSFEMTGSLKSRLKAEFSIRHGLRGCDRIVGEGPKKRFSTVPQLDAQ